MIVPDQRGYNLSDKPKDVKSYLVDELVKDALGLIDALGYEKVNLVGHDWGGGVAWELANAFPERVHRLGILNAPHPAVMARFLTRDLEQIRRSWYIVFFQFPWIPETSLRAGNWRGAERALRGTSNINSFTNADILKYKEAWSQPGAMTAMLNAYRAAARYRWKPNEGQVKVPTLMMWGMKDFALSHRQARPSMDYVKDGNLILFPEATHWVHLDAAEEVNHYLVDFVLDKISQQVIR